ncbi:MAG: chemotaxis protein CheW [Magnetococcales bacterium]|nr:chemotaxis protein CheW [Magnetococcales bacterium]
MRMQPTLDDILAQPRPSRDAIVSVDEETHKWVIFELAGERFGFLGERVREIFARARVFFVPGCPPSMEGVINVRGDIETVIRPHALLQLPDGAEPGRASTILIGRGDGITSGIRVDRVVDLLDLPQSAILSLPATLPEAWRAYAIGVIRHDDRAVTLLDLSLLLAAYGRGLG